MSRVGKKRINIPSDVEVNYHKRRVIVKGNKGSLSLILNSGVDLLVDDNVISVVVDKQNKSSRALQGLTRSLVSNMIIGVSNGFEKSLEINGIGYRVELKSRSLVLSLGCSHPIKFNLPEDIDAVVDRNIIKLTGISKEKVGQVASSIRQLKPPEPYKGKGIKYIGEYVRRKAGKTGAK